MRMILILVRVWLVHIPTGRSRRAPPADIRMTNHSPARLRPALIAATSVVTASLALAACASPGAQEPEPSDPAPTEGATSEQAAASPRIALTYDGGIQVLDAASLELIDDIPLEGFNRLNPAGDERHALVSTAGGFQVLDLGSWGEPHGDHAHYYAAEPSLLELTYPAEVPGHAVVHHGRTALFDDGTGQITVIDSAAIADPGASSTQHATPTAHHGVAIELTDGTLVVTEGTADARTGAVALDSAGAEVASSAECPGIHGETVTEDEAVVFGCEDGALIYHDGGFTKVPAPTDFGRIGNLRSAPGSDIVLGDYNANPDGGPLTQVALIDVRVAAITLVDLGTEYTFRSLARDDDGHALVLGTDGNIHVIDTEEAAVERTIPVIDEWQVPQEWQEPRPTITMLAGSAYVSDPAGQQLLAVDIPTSEIWLEATLDVVPNEVVGASGDVPEAAGEVGHDDHEHDHDGHDDEDHDH